MPIEQLKNNLRRSVLGYGARQAIVISLIVGWNVLLSRLVGPTAYGDIVVIQWVYTVYLLIVDAGLGAYLVQSSETVDDRRLSNIVGLQLVFAAGFCAFVGAGTLFFDSFFPQERLHWMLVAAAATGMLTVVRNGALISVEWAVRVHTAIHVDIAEEIAFAVVAVGFALNGFGAWSFVFGLLAKGLVGALVAWTTRGFRWRRPDLRCGGELPSALRFGLRHQAAQLVNMARVLVNPLFIIPMLGIAAAGMVDRAWYIAGAMPSILLAILRKTLFPYIARMRGNPIAVREVMERSIFLHAVVDKVVFLPLILLAPEFVRFILGETWLPMVPLLYWLLVGNSLFGALAGPLYPVAVGLARPDLVLRFNLIVMISSWVLIVPLTMAFGITGVGIAGFILSLSIIILQKQLAATLGRVSYWRQIAKPVLVFAVMLTVGELWIHILESGTQSAQSRVFIAAFATSGYVAGIWLLERTRLHRAWKLLSGGDAPKVGEVSAPDSADGGPVERNGPEKATLARVSIKTAERSAS